MLEKNRNWNPSQVFGQSIRLLAVFHTRTFIKVEPAPPRSFSIWKSDNSRSISSIINNEQLRISWIRVDKSKLPPVCHRLNQHYLAPTHFPAIFHCPGGSKVHCCANIIHGAERLNWDWIGGSIIMTNDVRWLFLTNLPTNQPRCHSLLCA